MKFWTHVQGKKSITPANLKLLYYGHIYSHMSYCVAIWGNMAKEELLGKIHVEQNKCVRLLSKTCPHNEIYKKHKILKLD